MTGLGSAIFAVLLAAASSAPAARPAVVIAVVAPSDADPAVTEALSRFRGEAASVGFEVTVVVTAFPATMPNAQLESAARAVSAVARWRSSAAARQT